jgi:hypothetical protein
MGKLKEGTRAYGNKAWYCNSGFVMSVVLHMEQSRCRWPRSGAIDKKYTEHIMHHCKKVTASSGDLQVHSISFYVREYTSARGSNFRLSCICRIWIKGNPESPVPSRPAPGDLVRWCRECFCRARHKHRSNGIAKQNDSPHTTLAVHNKAGQQLTLTPNI